MKKKIIVIGGLAAGPTAASKAKRDDPEAEVLLYEQGEYISYGVCEIPYFISDEISDPAKLIVYSPERLQKEKGVTAKTCHLVEEILPAQKEVRIRNLEDGTVFTDRYDKVILATGSSSKRINIDGEKSRNVFYIKALDAAYALKKFMVEEKPMHAVIVGAGFIGMEMADALSRAGLEVTVIHRGEYPMSNLEIEGKKILLQELQDHGIRFLSRTVIEWLGVGARGNVVAVGTNNGTVDADLVIIAVGVEPNSALARQAGIKVGNFGGICVNDKMKVLGAENVFAAGDCCELKNIVTRKPMYTALATTASKTARVAGENAAGGNRIFKGAIRAIGVRVFRKEVALVGLSLGEATEANFKPYSTTITANSKIKSMPGNSELTVTLISDRSSQKVLGANIIGNEGAVLRADTIAAAIRHGFTMGELEQLDLIYNPPYAPLWDAILIAARHAEKNN
jgi:NADPH-dependent 2,4-dienoyl-CoA reductase/sulfur reductase-like enzyme